MDRCRIPVLWEPVQRDVVLRHPLTEFERPGADRVQAEILALLLGYLGRQDHTGAVRQLRQERRGRLLQHHAHRQRIHHFDMIDAVDLAFTEATRHGQVTLERCLYRRRVQFLSILKQHVGAQMQDQRLGVGPLMTGGELRHDLQFRVDVEQLVAQAGENDTPDVGAGQRQIQNVGILPQCDAQGLRRCRAGQGGQHGQCRTGNGQQGSAH